MAAISLGIDSRPPLKTLVPQVLQHFSLGAITLIIPRVVAETAGADAIFIERYLSLAMIAVGLATLLQAWGRRGIGSGYLLPACYSGIYTAPALALAAKHGLPAVAGLAIVAGATEITLSFALRRIRAFFPSEVIGTVVLMVGISWGTLGLTLMTGLVGRPQGSAEAAIALFTLLTTVGFALWGSKAWRTLAVLVGLSAGGVATIAALMIGGPMAVNVPQWHVAGPVWPLIVPEFHSAFLPAFILGGIASFIRSSGDIIASHVVSDANWKRADFRQVSAGTLATGLGAVIAGCLGVMPINTNSGSVGLVAANGVAARRVALGVGLMWTVLGIIPEGSTWVLAIPPGVAGAAICFTSAFVMRAGTQLLTQRLLDNRRTLTIGLTLLIGLTFDDLVSKLALPPGLKMTFASSVLTAVAFALLLSVVFRIGIKRSIGHQWTPDAGAGDLCAFIEDCGRQWGARADLIRRAREFLEEFSEASRSLVTRDQPVEIRADYDDVSLRLELVWRGRAVPTDGYIPTLDSLEGDADVAVAIALMRHRADRVSFTTLDSHTQRAVAILDE